MLMVIQFDTLNFPLYLTSVTLHNNNVDTYLFAAQFFSVGFISYRHCSV